MEKDIFVTGLGIISSIGNDVKTCFESLSKEKSGIDSIKYLDTIHKDIFKVGEVKLSNSQLFDLLDIPEKEKKHYTRTSLLALIAAKEAVVDSGIDVAVTSDRLALVSATTVGGMDRTELELSGEDTSFLRTHPCGDSTNKIADYLNHRGYRTTLSTACSSGTNAIIHAINLIKYGEVDSAIVGGVDALSKFTLNGFNSLMILDTDFCKPFDEERKGLNIGEGAGFIVIESEEAIRKRNKKPICKITGYANANDAYHQTASSPDGEGAYRAMDSALTMSGLNLTEIDYINVHGTGTSNNDLSEGVAIKRIFGEEVPKFSSTKSYTGHTLGAAAGIEAVFSVLAIKNDVIYPNLNFKTPITELGISPQTHYLKADLRNVLSNSFGFGGNNSTIIFSKL